MPPVPIATLRIAVIAAWYIAGQAGVPVAAYFGSAYGAGAAGQTGVGGRLGSVAAGSGGQYWG